MTKTADKHERAEELFFLAEVLAISTAAKLHEDFPILADFAQDLRHSGFLMTIAAIGTGVILVDPSVSEEDYGEFSRLVVDRLKEWDFHGYQPYGPEGASAVYLDLANWVRNMNTDDGENFLGVGYWFVLNLKGSQPTNEEAVAGGQIGRFLAISLHDWWNLVQSDRS
jgi:hypothetical protein